MEGKKEIANSQNRLFKNKSFQARLISFCERKTVHVDREK